MELGYDIFRRLDDGTPVWVAQVSTMSDAEELLAQLVRAAPGEYFVRDAASGAIVSVVRPEGT